MTCVTMPKRFCTLALASGCKQRQPAAFGYGRLYSVVAPSRRVAPSLWLRKASFRRRTESSCSTQRPPTTAPQSRILARQVKYSTATSKSGLRQVKYSRATCKRALRHVKYSNATCKSDLRQVKYSSATFFLSKDEPAALTPQAGQAMSTQRPP